MYHIRKAIWQCLTGTKHEGGKEIRNIAKEDDSDALHLTLIRVIRQNTLLLVPKLRMVRKIGNIAEHDNN